VYACSALVSEDAYDSDTALLRGYARKFALAVVLANYATESGGLVPPGKSAVWAPGGELVAVARGCEEALVVARRAPHGTTWTGEVLPLVFA
jgi:predicted amidohydrolase